MRKDIREGVMIYVINEIKPNYAALAKQQSLRETAPKAVR
ncbi:hypothetical protein IGI71_000796 [Enterococcus sp. DIV1279b]|nr:hypothetical protein UAM_00187 [Enterococcus casseliflavus ATCC 49996]EOU10263.1 hypothetical protein I582_00774 [Enterococcus casseliflavus ATCC 49996]